MICLHESWPASRKHTKADMLGVRIGLFDRSLLLSHVSRRGLALFVPAHGRQGASEPKTTACTNAEVDTKRLNALADI